MSQKWLTGFLMACLLFFCSALQADALSPPKKICAVDKASSNLLLAVSCKPNGKLRFGSSSVTLYQLTGLMAGFIPAVGSGYVLSSNVFYFLLSGGHVLWVQLDLETGQGSYDFFLLGGGSSSGDLEGGSGPSPSLPLAGACCGGLALSPAVIMCYKSA